MSATPARRRPRPTGQAPLSPLAPVERTHDELIEAAREIAHGVSLQVVADAFLASLSSHRLELRSALGSWMYLHHLPAHAHEPASPAPDAPCRICGLLEREPVDVAALQFERRRWGGAKLDRIPYATFDLTELSALEPVQPIAEDRFLLRRILELAATCPPEDTPATILTRLTKTHLPVGNRQERAGLIDILGMCGILRAPGRAPFFEAFVPVHQREPATGRFAERAWPVCWWRGCDGVDRTTATAIFGSLR